MARRALLACALAACAAPGPGDGRAIDAPHPLAATALPLAPADTLSALAARDDADAHAAVRAHAWRQWAALTRAPAFAGWLRSDQVFSAAPLAATRELAFRPPHAITLGGAPIRAAPLLYDVLLDDVAARYVRDHGFARRAAVAAAGPRIPEMPVASAAIKRVWVVIHARGLTAVPVWDGATAGSADGAAPPEGWPRVVAVDPSRTDVPADETALVTVHGAARRVRVVPLARFAHQRLTTDAEVRTARAVVGAEVARGDEVALVALHLTTKEIPEWTWATWWWHDRADAGPFAADRPADVTGWAASYLMDATVRLDGPCMNPWLEARFPGGAASSCGACHQRAALGAREFLPPPRAATPDDDPYFADKVRTDFLWSIAFEAKSP